MTTNLNTDFGMTPQGFRAKRLADVQQEFYDNLSTIVDPKTGETLEETFDEDSPFTQSINVVIDAISNLWDLAEVVVNQYDPSKTSGVPLQSLVQLNGIIQNQGVPTVITLELTGQPGITIPSGQIVADTNITQRYITAQEVVLDSSGNGAVIATSTENNTFDPAVDTIISIITPRAGWESVRNVNTITVGAADEIDSRLKYRRDNSTLKPASVIIDSVRSTILNVTGVTFCRVYNNFTQTIDANGIPAKKMAVVVVGGLDNDVGSNLLTTIWSSDETFGNTAVNYTDSNGVTGIVYFVRPDPVPIFVEITIAITNEALYTAGGGSVKIKQNIVDYSVFGSAGVGIDEGFRQEGFPPGSTVLISRLYTPINEVPGHSVISIGLSLDGVTYNPIDISTAYDEYPLFEVDNITVIES